jgi:hypothetical protein
MLRLEPLPGPVPHGSFRTVPDPSYRPPPAAPRREAEKERPPSQVSAGPRGRLGASDLILRNQISITEGLCR